MKREQLKENDLNIIRYNFNGKSIDFTSLDTLWNPNETLSKPRLQLNSNSSWVRINGNNPWIKVKSNTNIFLHHASDYEHALTIINSNRQDGQYGQ